MSKPDHLPTSTNSDGTDIEAANPNTNSNERSSQKPDRRRPPTWKIVGKLGILATLLTSTVLAGGAWLENNLPHAETSTSIDDAKRQAEKEDTITEVKLGPVNYSLAMTKSTVEKFPATSTTSIKAFGITVTPLDNVRKYSYHGEFNSDFVMNLENSTIQFNETTGVGTLEVPKSIFDEPDAYGVKVNIDPGTSGATAGGNSINTLTNLGPDLVISGINSLRGESEMIPGITSVVDNNITKFVEIVAYRETGLCTAGLFARTPELRAAVGKQFADQVKKVMEATGVKVNNVIVMVDGQLLGQSNADFVPDNDKSKTLNGAASAAADTLFLDTPLVKDPKNVIEAIEKKYADAGITLAMPELESGVVGSDGVPSSFKCGMTDKAKAAIQEMKDN